MLKAIDQMDADKIVADMKQAILDMEAEAPELKGTVDPEAIDMMGTSIKFMQKAAKEFSPARLQEIYALEMPRLLDTDPSELEDVMKEIIAMAKAQPAFDAEMQKRELEFNNLGGDKKLQELGWPIQQNHALRCDLKRKIDILKNPGNNPPPKSNQPPPQQQQQVAH